MFVCELCQMQYSSEKGFLKHLNTHSKEEVKTLKKLAELDLRDPERYEEIVERLVLWEARKRMEES